MTDKDKYGYKLKVTKKYRRLLFLLLNKSQIILLHWSDKISSYIVSNI